jgi:hypothetical protein
LEAFYLGNALQKYYSDEPVSGLNTR